MEDRLRFQLLVFTLFILFMVFPVNAAFTWENNITVGYEGIQWAYTETYTEANSLIYKDYIDVSMGNGDGFISAWEVLKSDVKTRSALQNSIIEQMDVSVNGSSEHVVLTDVDSLLSPELLGPVIQLEVIKNTYTTNYLIYDPFLSSGDSSISFIGEASTPVVINMPEGVSINFTEGIENVSFSNYIGYITIIGNFGPDGKATVHFHLQSFEDISASFPEATEMNVSGEMLVFEDDGKSQDSFLAGRIFPGLGICNPKTA
jgi:hypothetical protein